MSETVNKIAILSSAVKHALLADVQYYDFHASSAFNRKMKGIITPGIYGGFKPALAGGLNLKITSLQGPGGHGVASVDVNNHQITVQQIEDVTLAIPANGVTRVMLEANYQYGIKTSQVDDSSDIHAARIFTANISVPLADNHLEICRVTVPADATELTLDMIDSSHRQNKALGITLSSEIDSDADHIGASSHAVKKAVKAARDETEKQIEELVDNAPASLDTLKKIADAINNDPDFFNTLNAVLALKAPLHDPALTGIATVPTPPLSVSNKQIANTEFVQAAVAALVGSSPEALDTLAELADALGNDPNFATTMLNKLAGKQPLHEVLTSLSGLNSAANKLAFFNGPNSMALANLTAVGRVLIGQESVAKVLEYLGLVETINKAAGSLQKDQNLSDIPDKAQARNALQLGTAATATLTTSTTDDATGRVLKVGDRGLGKVTIPALRGFDFYQYWFAAGETLFIETNSAINFPPGMPEFANTYVYVNVVGIRDSGNDCALLLSRYDTNISYLAWRIHEANTSINWRVLKIPTAAADIRAIPKDPIGTIGNNGRMASADTPGWWLVSVADAGTVADFPQYPNGNRLYSYGFMFVARSGNVWLQQYFSHTGASASRQTWNGDMSERTPWVIDYSTANKPTATDVGALPITGGGLNGNLGIGTTNALGGNSIVLGDNDTGFKQNGDGILDVYANSAH
ncbi:TPA: hypothetical protein L3F01_004670, partial [Citrobacter freundii]|nr:hypothetical protein [Citrobacter freundii]